MDQAWLKYYTMFCGVFLYENDTISESAFSQWEDRLEDSTAFTAHFKRNYYPNYLSNIMAPESAQNKLRHLTHKRFHNRPAEFSIQTNGVSIRLLAKYLDVFLFDDGVGIFSFKVELNEGQLLSYENISATLNSVRNPHSVILLDGQELSVLNFVRQFLEPSIRLRENWADYIPQLKAYTMVEDSSQSTFSYEVDQRLFELSHIIPIGSFQNSEFSPSLDYVDYVERECIINPFANWKAMVLFDSFTRIACTFPDRYKTWEHEYFLIYIHCLYTKFQLYNFNTQLTDVLKISERTSNLRNKFIEFINDYNLAYISYKFLPNMIYEKVTDQ